MIRYTSEKLPFIPYINELNSLCQPIGIRNVLSYLILAIEKNECNNKIIEIGGTDILKYIDMIKIYLKIRGIKKPIFSCPFNKPELCAKVISLLSPIPHTVTRNLPESLKVQAIKTSKLADEIFSEIKPLDYITQIQYALQRVVWKLS